MYANEDEFVRGQKMKLKVTVVLLAIVGAHWLWVHFT